MSAVPGWLIGAAAAAVAIGLVLLVIVAIDTAVTRHLDRHPSDEDA